MSLALGFLVGVPMVIALLIGLVLYFAFQASKQRRAAMLGWAAARGWTVVDNDPTLPRRWSGAPFGRGASRRASAVLSGTFAGRPCLSFDYRYTTGSGKNRSTHSYHVTAMALPVPLPSLQFTPEGVGTTIAKVFGGGDIEFESELFNQMWRVQSSVPRFAFDVVHPRLMERLLMPDARMPLRFEHNTLLCWAAGHQQPAWIDGKLALMDDVVRSVPEFVWRQVGYDPPPGAASGGTGPVGHAR